MEYVTIWAFGGVAGVFALRFLWRAYTHPAHVLGRQAANMNWVAVGRVEDSSGYKNMKVARDGVEAAISFENGNVELLKPLRALPFKDFIELERWLATEDSLDRDGSFSAPRLDPDTTRTGYRETAAPTEPDLHAATDESVQLLVDSSSLEHVGGQNARLYSELLVYAVTELSRVTLGYDFDAMAWNTYKHAVENRMLAVRDDGSDRAFGKRDENGLTLIHRTSDYWPLMDELDRLISNSIESGAEDPEVAIASWFSSRVGADWQILRDLLGELEEISQQRILPDLLRTFG